MSLEVEALNHAARNAWAGFWHSCMRGVGATSCLPFDAGAVADALAVESAPPIPSGLTLKGTPTLNPIVHRGKSEWAKQLEGDERISDVKLSDVLIGLEDYFKIFRQLKKTHKPAYEYFSRVGAPLAFENGTKVWARALDTIEPIANPVDLPAYLGVFMPRSREAWRDTMINDTPSMLDFQLYEKRRRNIMCAAPGKWTIYDHMEFSLDRDHMTKAERRKFPHARGFSFHYYIGVGRDGEVKALPMQMNTYQPLNKWDGIHHSRFIVPPGLKDMAGDKLRSVDQFCAIWFSAIRAFGDAALSGVQLSVSRGGEVARFGIPLAYVRSFFRDREREGARRKPLLHLVGEYYYQRGNKTVTVGEHLRGARRFTWRDYSITISAPGIHHASPEALNSEMLTDEDILPVPDNTITIGEVGAMVQKKTESASRVPFRKGQPTIRYATHSLSVPAP